MNRYPHKKIEAKWRRIWRKTGLYKTPEKPRSKQYVLDMFPYPSGDGLHVGHPKGYIATDVYSRMKRMQGHDILHPMGWDGFGLPAENYAIVNKVHPSIAVRKNIRRFKSQLEKLGFNYDWSREINTTDPAYYKWTQWIFLQMFHRGLAYRSNEPINWCPSCQTGLANEDLEDGRCERCGSPVEKRPVPQWVLRITDYADRLLYDLDGLEWPEHIKESQRNWIGRSEGAVIKFQITNTKSQTNSKIQNQMGPMAIEVFTTRADTIFSGTFIVVAPEHPLIREAAKYIQNRESVARYVAEAARRTEIDRTAETNKTGVELRGIRAINPATGKDIPVWAADFVLGHYGTGAVFADAHDARDFEMAKIYRIPLTVSVKPENGENWEKIQNLLLCFSGEGILVNSGQFDGLTSAQARSQIIEWLSSQGQAKKTINYRLRDWVFSRQRYWGEPIPLVFCPACKTRAESLIPLRTSSSPVEEEGLKIKVAGFSRGERLNPGWVGVPEKRLPVKLPVVTRYEPAGTGESPLANIESFVRTKCPKCGGPARRETNTMPQWAGSCWYYLAYAAGIGSKGRGQRSKVTLKNSKRVFERWLPVDVYVGGAEHATRHLIYARFWHKFLHDIDIAPTSEPFRRLHNVGLILASDGRKMSKRYGNVVNPDDIVERLGADALRICEMFMGPFGQSISWSENGLVGARRFVERVWKMRLKVAEAQSRKKRMSGKSPAFAGGRLRTLLHQTIKKVGDDIETFRFNTAVSGLMILLNAFEKEPHVAASDFKLFLLLLAPFAPHLAEELWEMLGEKRSIHRCLWPAHDEGMARGGEVTIVVQVNGKVRASFTAARGEAKGALEAQALSLPALAKWLVGKSARKIVVVPDRLVNVVV